MRLLVSVLVVAAASQFGAAASDSVARRAELAREANRIDEAIELYKKAVDENPRWTEGWWYLGTLQYDQDKYAEAVKAFDRAVALDPKSGTTFVMLGLCEAKLNQPAAALQHLQRGKKLGIADDPQLRHVMLYTLATLWLQRGDGHGDFENAQDALDGLAREGVESDELLLALGHAVLRTRLDEGDVAMARAFGHAELLAAQRSRATEAMSEYESLVSTYSKVPNVQFAFGKFLVLKSYDERAVAAFQREIENSPKHLLARLGIAGLKSGTDPAEALPYSAEAVTLAPELPEAHYLFGMCLLGTGKVEESIHQLETAQTQSPRDAKIPFALARAYSRAKRPADAARARAAFLKLKAEAEQNAL